MGSEPNLTSVPAIDVLLAAVIVLNLVLALTAAEWQRAGGWFVAGTCLLQACMWRSAANSWKAAARGRI